MLHFKLFLFISVLLFSVSGGMSTFLYYSLRESGGFIFPGLLYTSTTVLIFLLTKNKIHAKGLLAYYSSMILTYLIIWILTLFSSWFVFICGPITAGIGAVASFMVTDKFIAKMEYKRWTVFFIGSLAFLLAEVLHLSFINKYDKAMMEYYFKIEFDPVTLFVEVFFFWHILVGTKLFVTLCRK